jgi:Ca2+-binding EF-hand superfamily protein
MRRTKPISRFLCAALAVAVATAPLLAAASVARAQGAGRTSDTASGPSVLDRIRAKQREMATPEEQARRWFDNLDADKNEEVTKQELYDGLRQRFRALDANNDGIVSVAEYLGDRRDAEAGTRRFGELDSNGDGRLTMEEFASPADWRFDRIDRNLDGKISRAEAQRQFERPLGSGAASSEGECFYVERQVVRVPKDQAESYRKKGFPEADCYWVPDSIDLEKLKQQAK